MVITAMYGWVDVPVYGAMMSLYLISWSPMNCVRYLYRRHRMRAVWPHHTAQAAFGSLVQFRIHRPHPLLVID